MTEGDTPSDSPAVIMRHTNDCFKLFLLNSCVIWNDRIDDPYIGLEFILHSSTYIIVPYILMWVKSSVEWMFASSLFILIQTNLTHITPPLPLGYSHEYSFQSFRPSMISIHYSCEYPRGRAREGEASPSRSTSGWAAINRRGLAQQLKLKPFDFELADLDSRRPNGIRPK